MQGAYAVVERPGAEDQCVVISFPTFRAAALYVKEWYDPDDPAEVAVDVMKITPDGLLTTEF